MSKTFKKFFAGLLAFVLVFAMTAVAAPAKEAKAADGAETVAIGAEVSYTGLTTPGYTFDSSCLSAGKSVGAMVFNITVNLPAEGDVAWNDWCGEALAVHANGETKYYDFGGAQVGWGIDMNGDEAADTTGVGSASWVGSVTAARTLTVAVPVNAETFTIDFFDNCWDAATDIPHYTIHSATAVYGTVAATETVAIGQEVGYTGLTESGYTFDSSVLTTEGTAAVAVFNINIALPAEGDVAWNDWCGEAAKVTVGDKVSYYDFGGAQVGWGIDMTGDEVADTTGVGTASWAGSAENRSISAVFPINGDDFTVDFYDNCWDSATDMTHYTINSATILYGTAEVSAQEPVATPAETVSGAMIGGTPYEGEMTVFLAMQGDVSASGAWDATWANGSTDVEGIAATMVTNAKPGDTVTVGLNFPDEVIYTWWVSPVVMLNDASADTVTTLNYTIDKITIDGLEVTPDLTVGDKEFWYEGTGDYTDTQAIRLKGGYNEWADKYIESPANYQEIMYTITFGDVITGQTAGIPYDGEVTMFLASQADRAASNDWAYTWANGAGDTEDVVGTVVTAKNGDTVTLSLTYPEPVVHTWWLAPAVVLPEGTEADKYGVVFTIDKVTLDDVDVTDKVVLDSSKKLSWYEGTGTHPVTRTLRLGGGYNEWPGEENNAQCVEGTLLEGYKKVEYTITVDAVYMEPKEEEIQLKADLDATYNTYIGVQTADSWAFRNAWDDATYGKDSAEYPEAFNQISIADSTLGLVKKDGTIIDTVLEGNGTYTVSLKDFDFASADGSVAATALTLLFVSTDIPNSGEITLSNIKVDFDGKNVMEFAEGFEDPDSKEWYKVLFINIWNKDLTNSHNMEGMIPAKDITITFDVTGFNYDKVAEVTPEPTEKPVETPIPEEPTAAPTEAPVAAEPTEAPAETPVDAEGGMSPVVIVVIVVAVIAIAAAAAFVVMKKKK